MNVYLATIDWGNYLGWVILAMFLILPFFLTRKPHNNEEG